jgi:hypothetical protein
LACLHSQERLHQRAVVAFASKKRSLDLVVPGALKRSLLARYSEREQEPQAKPRSTLQFERTRNFRDVELLGAGSAFPCACVLKHKEHDAHVAVIGGFKLVPGICLQYRYKCFPY